MSVIIITRIIHLITIIRIFIIDAITRVSSLSLSTAPSILLPLSASSSSMQPPASVHYHYHQYHPSYYNYPHIHRRYNRPCQVVIIITSIIQRIIIILIVIIDAITRVSSLPLSSLSHRHSYTNICSGAGAADLGARATSIGAVRCRSLRGAGA